MGQLVDFLVRKIFWLVVLGGAITAIGFVLMYVIYVIAVITGTT